MKLAICHPNRKVRAKNLCGSCYESHLKSVNPIYKENQKSNGTLWARKNPDKVKAIKERRKNKQKLDPNFKAKRRNDSLVRNYGLTQLDFDKINASQKGRCAICRRYPSGNKPLHVDHDHKTGTIRGLLCHQCNWFMGTIDAGGIDLMIRLTMYGKVQSKVTERNISDAKRKK